MKDATIYEIEDLSKIKHGFIRKKGVTIISSLKDEFNFLHEQTFHTFPFNFANFFIKNNIGSVLYRKEDYSGALAEFHKALKTCENYLGKIMPIQSP